MLHQDRTAPRPENIAPLRNRAATFRLLLLSVALCAVPAGSRQACGQGLSETVPSGRYFSTFNSYYGGNYRDAIESFQDEGRGGIKTVQSRWIDSICYHTMTGECYYQMGRLPEALDQYTSAVKLYVAYFSWMTRVNFDNVVPPAAGTRPVAPWGQSKRLARMGRFKTEMAISMGQIDNSQPAREGGVIQQPFMIQVHVSEIVRCTALAIRRRRELMGPVSKYDVLNTQLVAKLLTRPGRPNHWSEAWIDVQLGMAYAAAGNITQAAGMLERSLLAMGEFDHPLTSMALLELGKLALEAGDFKTAARLFEETTYSAFTFFDLGILEEAFRYGQRTHLMANGKGVYPPLATAIAWSKTKGYTQLHVSLCLLAAENLAVLGQTTAAATMLGNARSSAGRRDILAGVMGARLNHLTALTLYQTGNVGPADSALKAALTFQTSGGSLWVFQLGLADNLYTSAAITERVAVQLYEVVLRDPIPVDWAGNPLECLSILATPHYVAYEHWFQAALAYRKGPELALEVADRARRHRFYSTLPLGGRLLALRWILEGPEELLSDQATLQRQELLSRYPKYADLARQARKIREDLAGKRLVEEAPDARNAQSKALAGLAAISQTQELILREIAVRREPADFVFPPLRQVKDIQKALPQGDVVLTFFATSNEVYAFMLSSGKYAAWRIASFAALQKNLKTMLRDLGNYEQNYQLSAADLTGKNWRKSTANVADQLFGGNVNLSEKFNELIVVPDGALWYLPFEALPIGREADAPPLIKQVRVRYAPTLGLAVPYVKNQKAHPNVGVVLGKLHPADETETAQHEFERLAKAAPGAVALTGSMPAPSSIYRTLFDGWIVLDDVETENNPFDWSPGQLDRGKPGGSLADWQPLPWGGPTQVIFPGFHSGAETLSKRNGNGSDLFLAVCGLMSSGARTVLISRWRPGGQTSYNLVREYAQELPHTSPADAWQRSVQLVTESPLDPELEPRLKRQSADAQPSTADHPFFWAGYMLVDSGRLADNAAPPPVLNIKKKAVEEEDPPAKVDPLAKRKPNRLADEEPVMDPPDGMPEGPAIQEPGQGPQAGRPQAGRPQAGRPQAGRPPAQRGAGPPRDNRRAAKKGRPAPKGQMADDEMPDDEMADEQGDDQQGPDEMPDFDLSRDDSDESGGKMKVGGRIKVGGTMKVVEDPEADDDPEAMLRPKKKTKFDQVPQLPTAPAPKRTKKRQAS